LANFLIGLGKLATDLDTNTTMMRRWLNVLFYGVLCICLLVLPVYGLSINELKQQKQHIQTLHNNVVREHHRLTHLQIEAQQNLAGLNQNLQTTTNEIQESEKRLTQASLDLTQLEADLDIAERDYQTRLTAVVARLRFLQRTPTSLGWAVLLQSQDINDFIRRRHRLKLVYQTDQRILAKLSTQAEALIKQKTNVEGQRNLIALMREQLLAQKSDVQSQSVSQAALVQRLNSDRLALEAAQNQLEKDSQNLASLIQKKVAEQVSLGAIHGTGVFAYPSNAPISSTFGWRMHPILHYRRFHDGLDFAATYGSTIHAADSGIVIYSGWYGGYGKAVIINHGRGLTTLYGHTSEVYVREGQRVERGQAIAAVGSTGFSTGPHLHFEVRRDGTPVNPANYL
jgi:murein DD-endopeptidase MepM/ murein hydrolase activator NlpD